MPREPILPTLRAATFAAVCLALGAGAHRAMSAGPVPVWALFAGGLGAFLPSRWAARRGEAGLAAIAALMGAVQLGLHLLFSFAQQVQATAATGGGAAGSGVQAMGMPTGMAMPGAAAGVTSASMHMSLPGMLVGHAAAALACTLWLWRGEASLHGVLRRALLRLRALWLDTFAPIAPPGPGPRAALVVRRSEPARFQWRRGVRAERGPPLPVAEQP